MLWELLLYLSFAWFAVGASVGCCCGNPCLNCSGGSAAHANVQVVIAGITNGLCSSCASWNGTFILVQQTPATPCAWQLAITRVCLANLVNLVLGPANLALTFFDSPPGTGRLSTAI
jgi:hypothetical protein